MRLKHLVGLMAGLFTSISPVAKADIAPEPEAGEKFVGTSVEFVGLDTDAYVLLGWDKPYEGKISSYLSFTKDKPRLHVAHGQQRHNVYEPTFHLMPKATFEAWVASTQAIIGKQMEDCREGRGCAHISRFTPQYPPPQDALDCNLSLSATLAVPLDGPDAILARVKVVELGPKVCRLELITDGREALLKPAQEVPKSDANTPDKGADVGAPSSELVADVGTAPESPKAPISQTTAKKGCESGGATAFGLVLMAAWASRRRR